MGNLSSLKLRALTLDCSDCYGLPTIDPLRSGLVLKQLKELTLNFSCSTFPGQLRDLSPLGDVLPQMPWLEVLDFACARWNGLADLGPLRRLPSRLQRLG